MAARCVHAEMTLALASLTYTYSTGEFPGLPWLLGHLARNKTPAATPCGAVDGLETARPSPKTLP